MSDHNLLLVIYWKQRLRQGPKEDNREAQASMCHSPASLTCQKTYSRVLAAWYVYSTLLYKSSISRLTGRERLRRQGQYLTSDTGTCLIESSSLPVQFQTAAPRTWPRCTM